MAAVFITGGTGYIGSRLIPMLIAEGHTVTALARRSSTGKLPVDCRVVEGNALSPEYAEHIPPADTFIHLIGVAHPGPGKAEQFRDIDLRSIEIAAPAAKNAGIKHFIYLSVAHPAPVMQDFIAVRTRGEALLAEYGLTATIVRPWYVVGPGHYWPILLVPGYLLGELIPSTRETARRLGLVTLNTMLRTLATSAKQRPAQTRILNVQDIRQFRRLAK